MEEDTKKWWKSKTVWTNIVAIVSGIGAIFVGDVDLTAGLAPIIIAAVNIVLRILTKKPVIT